MLCTVITRRSALKALAGIGLGTIVGGSGYGYWYERYRLGTTAATLPVSGLPEALNGLRIALVTDLHYSRTVPRTMIEAAVALTQQAKPDLIVLGGDYVSFSERQFVEPVAELLAPLAAPHGVFAIIGNHDPEPQVKRALSRQGVSVLADERTQVALRGERLELVGVRFWTRKASDIARLLKGVTGTPILLAHDPRRLSEAAALDVPVVLSGHTHGGQVVLPVVGAVGARKFPIAAGLARRDNTTLFVSRGVGTVYVPVRFNCPPEIAILTLARQSAI